MATNPFDKSRQTRRQFVARTGDSGYTDEIDESGSMPCHRLDAFFGAGRGQHIDCSQAGLTASRLQQFRLSRRQIGDDQAINACLGRSCDKAFFAEGQNRIVVAHGAEGCANALGAQLARHFQAIGHCCAADKRRVGGGLNRRPVGQWIAVGNAEFDEIRAGLRQGNDHFQRLLPSRIAHGMIGHKRGAASLVQFAKNLLNAFDSAHFSPRAQSWRIYLSPPIDCMTVPKSLSPRPLRLTRTT